MRIRQSAEYAALKAGSAAGSVENAADWFANLAILGLELLADIQEDGLVVSVEGLPPLFQKLQGPDLKVRLRLGEQEADQETG